MGRLTPSTIMAERPVLTGLLGLGLMAQFRMGCACFTSVIVGVV